MKYKILHLPKTGGTALKSSLIPGYKIHDKKYMKSIIPEVYFCDHNEFYKNDKYIYVFFVRDPLRRFVSHFNFFKYASKYDTSEYFTEPKDFSHNFIGININDFILENNKESLFNIFMGRHHSLNKMIKNINEKTNNVLMVGTLESLNDDFVKMQKKLNVTNIKPITKTYTNKKPDNLKVDVINQKAKLKLREILNDEYESILKLVNLGYLPKEYLKNINY